MHHHAVDFARRLDSGPFAMGQPLRLPIKALEKKGAEEFLDH
jgi:hypothetical protein